MKRRTFIAMIAIFIAMIIAYTAFAMRCFYLRPSLVIQPDVDPTAAVAITAHYAAKGGVSCPTLTAQRLRHVLIHPLDASVIPAIMRQIGTVEVWVVHGPRAEFFKRDRSGKWNHEGISEWIGGTLRP